jgi:hypothetical protein
MVISQYCVHAPLNVNLIDSEMAFESTPHVVLPLPPTKPADLRAPGRSRATLCSVWST